MLCNLLLLRPIIVLHEVSRSSGGIWVAVEACLCRKRLEWPAAEGIVGGQIGLGTCSCIGRRPGHAGDDRKCPRRMLIAVAHVSCCLKTTSVTLLGGAMRWVADGWAARRHLPETRSQISRSAGTLPASGSTAGEAITGTSARRALPDRRQVDHPCLHRRGRFPVRRPLGWMDFTYRLRDNRLCADPAAAKEAGKAVRNLPIVC